MTVVFRAPVYGQVLAAEVFAVLVERAVLEDIEPLERFQTPLQFAAVIVAIAPNKGFHSVRTPLFDSVLRLLFSPSFFASFHCCN